MLREQVGWVVHAADLTKLELFAPQPLLDPKAVAFEVPQFAEPLA